MEWSLVGTEGWSMWYIENSRKKTTFNEAVLGFEPPIFWMQTKRATRLATTLPISFKDIKLYNIINAPFFIYTPIERVSGRIRLENIHFFLLIHKLV